MVRTRGTGSGSAATKRKPTEINSHSEEGEAEKVTNATKLDSDDSCDSGNEDDEEECSSGSGGGGPPPAKSARKTRRKPLAETTPINFNLRFEDLGGLQDQIRIIHDSIIFRQENSSALKKSGLKHTVGGILLEGPPGTGKTLCAHTIAAELSRRTKKQYTFFTHNAVESFSKWMGDSEKTIRRLFRAAVQCKPSIIFFDEFDSMCPRRDAERSGHSYKTIVGTLLAEFNNIQDNDIIVIATTNLKENIDPALLRNGRFDFFIHFPMPNEEQRLDILRIKMKNFTVQPGVLEFLAKHTDGYSGSSLTFLCDEAKLNAFKRQRVTEDFKRKPLRSVDKDDFLQVFRTVKLPKAMATCYQDALLDGVCRTIAQRLEPYIFREKDIMSQRDGTLDCNCYLVWSSDSNTLLNEKMIPKVLELLRERVYRISQDVVDNFRAQNYVSTAKAFASVVHQAKRSEEPCILLVENIDTLDINAEDLYRALGFLGNYAIFVLATSSQGPASLASSLQLLFRPFGTDKAFELPRPTVEEVYDCFDYVHRRYLAPVVSKSKESKAKKFASPKALVSEIMRIEDLNTFEKMNALRSEIRNLCRVFSASEPSVLIDKLWTLLQRQ